MIGGIIQMKNKRTSMCGLIFMNLFILTLIIPFIIGINTITNHIQLILIYI